MWGRDAALFAETLSDTQLVLRWPKRRLT